MLIVSVDGGCPGVKNVAEGVIGATSQQYPLLMASMGIEAIKKFAETARSRRRPRARTSSTPASTLVTDKPVEGVESIDTKAGLEKCWG